MNNETLNRIETLLNLIEERESEYNLLLREGSNYYNLKNIRTRIRELRTELKQLELSLLELSS